MIVLAGALTAALALERFTFALVSVLFYMFGRGADGKSTWFVTNLVQGSVDLAAGTVSAVFRLLSIGLKGLAWLVLIMAIWGVLYFAAMHSSAALASFQKVYNTDVGGLVRSIVLVPLRFALLILDHMIPIYNLLMYVSTAVPTRIFIENMLSDITDIVSCMAEIGMVVQTAFTSLFDWVMTLVNPPDSFDPGLRVLDLMTPLAHTRLAVSYALAWAGKMCSIATSVLDLACYPFMDINFGHAVHNLVNAVLYLVAHVPAVTVERCRVGGAVVYCLPDFYPVFDLLAMGLRHAGLLIDNWLDVALIIIQAALTNTSPACTGWTVADFHLGSDALMGTNETRVIGIDATSFAKTDGWNAELFTRSETQAFPDAFPFAVRLDYGIARVSASMDSKGIMGCKCTDEAWGMQIACAVAPLSDRATSFIVPVEFQIPTTSFYMGCARSKIKVESIRWPVNRYTTTSGTSSSTTALSAEAAIWVRPFCSSESIDIVCVETFTLAGCFPYCMGLLTKGFTGSIVLRDASEWAGSVSMINRDCGLHTWDVTSGTLAATTAQLRSNSGVTSLFNAGEVQTNGSHCVYSGTTLSRMVKASVGGYEVYRSVDLTSQPFAFAGDLVFSAVQLSTQTWGVSVARLWGNQANEFTIVAVNKFIPALPPCKTPSDCTAVDQSCAKGWCKVAVPYAFDSTPWAHIPAVTTSRYAFWITNPSMAMYYAVNQHCIGGQGVLAFIAESSYQSIQIWRFDPYEYCPLVDGVVKCPPDTTATYRKLPGFVSGDLDMAVCAQEFYVVAPSMTYVNEDNIAITALRTTFANVDTDTLRPRNASLARCVLRGDSSRRGVQLLQQSVLEQLAVLCRAAVRQRVDANGPAGPAAQPGQVHRDAQQVHRRGRDDDGEHQPVAVVLKEVEALLLAQRLAQAAVGLDREEDEERGQVHVVAVVAAPVDAHFEDADHWQGVDAQDHDDERQVLEAGARGVEVAHVEQKQSKVGQPGGHTVDRHEHALARGKLHIDGARRMVLILSPRARWRGGALLLQAKPLRVHVQAARVEDQVHLLVHPVVHDDVAKHLAQHLHRGPPAAHERPHLAHAVGELVLVALVRGGDAKDPLAVRLVLVAVRQDAFHRGVRCRHVDRQLCEVSLRQMGCLLNIHRLVAKLHVQRHESLGLLRCSVVAHWFPFFSTIFFSTPLKRDAVQRMGQHVRAVVNAQGEADEHQHRISHPGARRADAVLGVEALGGEHALGDEKRRVEPAVPQIHPAAFDAYHPEQERAQRELHALRDEDGGGELPQLRALRLHARGVRVVQGDAGDDQHRHPEDEHKDALPDVFV